MVKDLGVSVGGKHVLIIEEIIDEGKTLNFLKNRPTGQKANCLGRT
jgi:hypoxanthine-guanine phosphoribosyltransferase